MSDLKPCPFCGGSASMIHDDNHDHRIFHCFYAECSTCWSKGFGKDTKAEAIEIWNSRPAEAENDRLREALVAARADIAEWLETYLDDPGNPRSQAVLKQIDDAIGRA